LAIYAVLALGTIGIFLSTRVAADDPLYFFTPLLGERIWGWPRE